NRRSERGPCRRASAILRSQRLRGSGRDERDSDARTSSMSETAVFGKYGFIAELGHGGMADVYLAVARGPAGFSKLVVIKRRRANPVDDPQYRSMLVDEARLAGRLNHPNVVQTNEVAQVGEQFFIAMEYLEGAPLSRILHRSGTKGLPFAMHLRVI